PPPRNALCWCTSNKPYRDCHGGPGEV
ncbi:SEC-C metal-binding domain-containing protein, partial [Streptomyces lushanensis]